MPVNTRPPLEADGARPEIPENAGLQAGPRGSQRALQLAERIARETSGLVGQAPQAAAVRTIGEAGNELLWHEP